MRERFLSAFVQLFGFHLIDDCIPIFRQILRILLSLAGCLYDSIEKTEMWQEQLSVQYIWQEMVLQKKYSVSLGRDRNADSDDKEND